MGPSKLRFSAVMTVKSSRVLCDASRGRASNRAETGSTYAGEVDLRQFEYAVAVAEELHFGRAAARLHVAQQTVSEQVAKLERELGGALFVRSSRRVEVTSLGEAFLPEARRALEQFQHAAVVGRRAAGGTTPVRLGFAPSSAPVMTRVLLPGLRARLPRVPVLPVPGFTLELLEGLRHGRLDVALVWHPDISDGLRGEPLFGVPVALAVVAGSPLARYNRVPRDVVAAEPLIMLVPRQLHPRLHDHLLAGLADAPDGSSHTVRVVAEAGSTDRLLPLVVGGAGVGVTFANLADEHTPGVVYRRVEDPEPEAWCWVAWRSRDDRLSVTALVTALRAMAQDGLFTSDG